MNSFCTGNNNKDTYLNFASSVKSPMFSFHRKTEKVIFMQDQRQNTLLLDRFLTDYALVLM